MITLECVQRVLGALSGKTIGLIGDLFLDRYLTIDASLAEPSIETGLEAHQITEVRNSPGALGTIMNNLTALGVGRLVPVSVVGDDGQAYDLLKELRRQGVETSHIIQDPRRLTPTYTKPMRQDDSGVWRELNRLDLRSRGPLSDETEEAVLRRLVEVFHSADGLIVLDQVGEEGAGVVTPRVRQELRRLAAAQPDKLMLIDSRAHIGRFDCGTLKPNRGECLAAAGLAPSDDKDTDKRVEQAARTLAQRTKRTVFCTLGERGILVARATGESTLVPAYPVEGPIDTVGAGDSATAGIAAALLAGAGDVEAAALGNLVASVTVRQIGTTGTASPEHVLARWREAAAD